MKNLAKFGLFVTLCGLFAACDSDSGTSANTEKISEATSSSSSSEAILSSSQNQQSSSSESFVFESDETTYYYLIDTTTQGIYIHSNGQCLYNDGNPTWDPTADVNDVIYRYTFSNDTLYLKNADEITLVRTSGTEGSLEGTWKVTRYYNGLGYEQDLEGKDMLKSNRIFTISGDTITETYNISSSFDFTHSNGMYDAVVSLFNAQDSKYNGASGASSRFFSSGDDLLELSSSIYQYTIVSETTISLEILRNGRTFLLEVENPTYSDTERSITYKVSSNGITCTSNYKDVSITEDLCKAVESEPYVLDVTDNIVNGAETYSESDFTECFKSLFE